MKIHFNKNYLYKLESQNKLSQVYKLISHPIPSIIVAYFFIVLIVLCPLHDETNGISLNNLTYLLVYIPCVSFFCFAVFFPLTYIFLNLPRLPYNLKPTLILFIIVWVFFQSVIHFIFMLAGVFPIPFQWIVVAFGVGVPLIYLLVWLSISSHIKSGKDNNNNTLSDEKIEEIKSTSGTNNGSNYIKNMFNNGITKDGANRNIINDIENGNEIEMKIKKNEFINETSQIGIPIKENNEQQQTTPKLLIEESLSESLSRSLSRSIPKSSFPNTVIDEINKYNNYKTTTTTTTTNTTNTSCYNLNGCLVDEENELCKSSSSVSGSGTGISENEFDLSIEAGGIISPRPCPIDLVKLENNNTNQDNKDSIQKNGQEDEFISATTPRHYIQTTEKPMLSKGSFFFKWWIVSSTILLGPMGYVFFHLFLFAFYSVSNNLFQILLIIAFQLIVFIYKLIFRLSFHRMRKHLPNIPLRVFQDGRVLFLFWLELSSHCFFSMVFPHVGSWYMILIYLTLEAFTLTAQILVDTVRFRTSCIRLLERCYQRVTGNKYQGTLMYNILAQNGELDRSVSLEIFFFNTVARALSGSAYIVFSLTIYYGPNQDYYPTIKELTEFNYFLTLLYAAASLATALIHMYIFKRILKHIYKINLIKKGVEIWKRRPDVAFFFITNCFILPLVVLLQQNNAVSLLLSNLETKI